MIVRAEGESFSSGADLAYLRKMAEYDFNQLAEIESVDSARLVLEYAFTEVKLNRVELTADEANARAIRCYEKCGFVREGLLRQHRLTGGRFGNTVVMAILKPEWKRP